eukprot:5253730-Amphidinium_carterae.1
MNGFADAVKWRFEYDKTVETLGPFYFDPVPVFPLSSRFLSESNSSADSEGVGRLLIAVLHLRERGQPLTVSTTKATGAFPGADELQDLMCDPSVPSWIEDALVPMLNYSHDNKRLAHRIMEVNAAEVPTS